MLKVIRRQMQRDETPFLHVMRENSSAHGMYQRLGFRDYRERGARAVAGLKNDQLRTIATTNSVAIARPAPTRHVYTSSTPS